MISVFDTYVLKNFAASTFVTALSLTLIILLTQSIRFLELVISSDASAFYFLIMMGLAIPKFLEAILPLAFGIGAIYTAYKMTSERETIIMRAAGVSVTRIIKGFIIFSTFMMVFQFLLSGWLSPIAVESLQKTRADVKSHYATLMFREGVFNTIGNGLTAFVEKRKGLNELENLMIHDAEGSFNEGKDTTIIAKRGIVNLNETQQQLLIYNGTQYQKDQKTNTISRLDFAQYSLDIPTQDNTLVTRWKEPDERTFDRLFISSTDNQRDLRKQNEFIAEIHKRLSTPLLYPAFILMTVAFLFLSQWDRRNQSTPIIKAGLSILIIQAVHIITYNEARDVMIINAALYCVAILPILYGLTRIYFYQKAL